MKLFATLTLFVVSVAVAAPTKRQGPVVVVDSCYPEKWGPLVIGKTIVRLGKCLHGTHPNVFYAKDLPAGSRVIGPNDPVTADLRYNRLNVKVTANNVATEVYCG
ncbi:hypothetical protein FBU59_000601 [Linderina macrospora]|uniref:Uncharacterized protein n=1 Tax=Linderina macrospora TaxID=4868 RepID=A0ACC1JG70_9FUNG|nr:hypothetical protein FBU59_000601 [Linderina macrospora]